jgi:tetratricopeptide (TPR) repeat protein
MTCIFDFGMTRFKRALQLLEQRKFHEARQLLELLLAENPSEPDLLYNLGMLYSEVGDPDRAIELLAKCSQMQPDSANVYVAMGFAAYLKGEYADAKGHLLHALRLEPDNPYAHRNLGGIYGKQRNYRQALDHLKRAHDLLPKDPQTTYGLGHTYLEAGNFEKADRYLKEVIEMGSPLHLVNLAKDDRRRIATESLRAQGMRPDAIYYCISALERFAGKPDDLVRRVSFEVALLGRSGLDIHSADRKYRLNSLSGDFTGLQLVCLMYVGFQLIDPSADIGMDLSREYEAARKLFESGRDGTA